MRMIYENMMARFITLEKNMAALPQMDKG